MAIRLDVAGRNAALNAVNGLINDGPGTAKLQLWSGARPATLGGSPAGTLLAELPLTMATNGPFGAASAGVATAVTQEPTVGLANGTVGFVRVLSRQQVVRSDNDDVGTSGTEFVLDSLTVENGSPVTLTSWTRAYPG